LAVSSCMSFSGMRFLGCTRSENDLMRSRTRDLPFSSYTDSLECACSSVGGLEGFFSARGAASSLAADDETSREVSRLSWLRARCLDW
jgi:hypothetical protein